MSLTVSRRSVLAGAAALPFVRIPGARAATPGTLIGRSLADRLHQQLLHLAPETIALDARRTGINVGKSWMRRTIVI